MIQQQLSMTDKSTPTVADFINAFNASQARSVSNLKVQEPQPAAAPTQHLILERLTHETERYFALSSGEPERASAIELRYGFPSNPDKLREVCRRFAERCGGEQRELDSHLKKLNRELKRLDSELTVSCRVSSDLDLHKVEFHLVGPNGLFELITRIDRKPIIEKRRAEDIADLLSMGPLNRFNHAAIEVKLREALVEGGQAGFESLVKRTNEQLEKDCVDYRIACRTMGEQLATISICVM